MVKCDQGCGKDFEIEIKSKIQCPHCKHLLFYAKLADLEIKCIRCKKIITVKFEEQSEPHSK